MALDVTPEALSGELRRSLEARKSYLGETYYESIRRYYGPAYRSGHGVPTEDDFNNHSQNWIAAFLPVLASGNPRVRSKTPRLGPAATYAKAVELGVNRNFELTDIKKTVEQLATDWAFKYCVAMTAPRPAHGLMELEDPPHRPATYRLSLDDFGWDMLAKQQSEWRFSFHKLIRDKEDVLEEAESDRSWNSEALLALHEDRARERQRMGSTYDVRRNEVEFYEVWVPEITLGSAKDRNGKRFVPDPKKGYHGTIFTVSDEATGEFIREPRPFWGPRDGPYTFSGYLYIPDESVGLSPLSATAVQAEELNKTLAASIQAIRSHKVGVAVSSEMDTLAEKIATFMDQGVFTVETIAGEIQKHVTKMEVGGLSPFHEQHIKLLEYLLERSSGLTEAQQGGVSGDGTATEASIAQMASGRRMSYMTEKFINTVVKPIAKKEAWYLAADPRSRINLGELAEGLFFDPKTGQPIEMPILEGGPENVSLLEDNDIEIQPISMRYTTEMLEAERGAQWDQYLLTVVPMIPQMPYVDWGLMLSRKAEQLGDPSLARTVDIPKALALGQIQMAMQLGQPAPALQTRQNQSQPRLGVDMKSKAPTLKSSEKPTGFTGNARPGGNAAAQKNKGPRQPGTSASTR